MYSLFVKALHSYKEIEKVRIVVRLYASSTCASISHSSKGNPVIGKASRNFP